jgi:thiamine pyrophosphate-dependent acetolactate synthase large subunit-like protein
MKTYEVIARGIEAEGVTHTFAIMGDATLHWYGAMVERGIEMIDTRQEIGAVAMAEGYAHVAGDVGVASVTSGPGLVQAGLALANAARAGVPTVLFAGDTPTTMIDGLQHLDQRRFVEACGATFVPLRSPATALDDVRRAFAIARARRTAVVLNAPVDLQAAEHPGELEWPTGGGPIDGAVDPTPETIEQLCSLVEAASHPIVLVGRGAVLAGAGRALVELAEQIGAATATTLLAKGYLDDPYCLGVVGPVASAPADAVFAQADLVLAFGASLDRFTLMGAGTTPTFPNATVVAITTDPPDGSANALVDRSFLGDVARTASRLTDRLRTDGFTSVGLRSAETRERLFGAPRPDAQSVGGVLHPMRAMEILEGHLSQSSDRVVIGSGHFWSWPIMYLRRPLGGRFLFAHHFGSIGLGLPIGIGAAVADPSSRVTVVEGDGSIMETIQELDTASRCKLAMTVVVMNDQQLGAERFKGQLVGLPSSLMQIPTPDLGAVARAFGAGGALASDDAAMEAALSAATSTTMPFVIDARIDPDVICDMYRKLHFRLENVAPHQFLG